MGNTIHRQELLDMIDKDLEYLTDMQRRYGSIQFEFNSGMNYYGTNSVFRGLKSMISTVRDLQKDAYKFDVEIFCEHQKKCSEGLMCRNRNSPYLGDICPYMKYSAYKDCDCYSKLEDKMI